MKTLTLNFEAKYEVRLSLPGLSFKAVGMAMDYLARSEHGYYYLEYRDGHVDEKGAVKLEFLVKELKSLYEALPFDRLKFKGYYPLATPEQLYKLVTTN